MNWFNEHPVLFALVAACVAIAYGIGLAVWLVGRPAGTERMQEIAHAVQEGAAAYLRRLLVETAGELGIPVRDGGSVVTIQGPRFSTRAESRWFQGAGWDVINMTAYPEGYLARELELCYANISMVTDHDVGVEGTGPVSADTVMRVFSENNERLRELLFAAIPRIGPQPEDVCANALQGARVS